MSRLFTVIDFELKSYTKNKSFMITTIIMVVLLFAGSFLPRLVDMSSVTGVKTDTLIGADLSDEEDGGEGDTENKDDVDHYMYYDESGMFESADDTAKLFEEIGLFTKVENKDDLKKAVEDDLCKGAFVIKDDLHYEYLVNNSSMNDSTQMMFEMVLQNIHKQNYIASHGLDASSFMEEYEAACEGEVTILGKDQSENFWYCYILVIVIFMLIIMYGVMIATSVTNEKSNRSIEVLVTSIDAKYLLFGKVIAGTLAVVVQAGSILAAALIGYGINRDAWGNKLDMILHIPTEVVITFAVFGIGGFLFYAFAYGAVGALVSKTEDINKVAGTVQMVIMIVYFVVLLNLSNPGNMIMKVFSFLPISSYSAMFVRIAMGTVTMPEIIISAVILYISTFFMGWLAAKIYRMGTLRYGNPIKITKAIKSALSKD
ncbi:MAG: ABC transporter permease [Lachnospiraceae bacterium]|nr:ABC transporter permease [Lachnospiraceae bacterium]